MKKLNTSQTLSESGFSLIEMMLVVIVAVIVTTMAMTGFYGGSANTSGAEGLLENAAGRLVERRAAAVRLNGEDRRSKLQTFTALPLPIDFSDLSTTATLRINGTDDDADCLDDVTGQPLTCLEINDGNQGEWAAVYNDDPLKMPDGWQIAGSTGQLNKIPLIGGGANGRGVIATKIGFDATGKALAVETAVSGWQKFPTGSIQSDVPSAENAPFWAIYFVSAPKSKILIGKNAVVASAVALAVHPSGLIEKFRYDGSQWIGFQNRTLGGGGGTNLSAGVDDR